jgi:hypothetical protein
MNNPYLGYNPVFEQLAETARNNSNKLHEAVDINAEETQEYLTSILSTLSNSVKDFIGKIPYADLQNEIYPGTLEKYLKLAKNASINDLISNLYAIWADGKKKIDASKYSQSADFKKIYADVDAGINKVMESWAALQAKAGNILIEPSLLAYADSQMSTLIASVQKALEDAKVKLS